jgi:hypothetical protein
MAYKMPPRSFLSTASLSTLASAHPRSATRIFHSSSAASVCTRHINFSCSTRAALSSYTRPTSAMEVELTAPNGTKWSQPLGLYINGKFVKSSNGQKITSINPS